MPGNKEKKEDALDAHGACAAGKRGDRVCNSLCVCESGGFVPELVLMRNVLIVKMIWNFGEKRTTNAPRCLNYFEARLFLVCSVVHCVHRMDLLTKCT